MPSVWPILISNALPRPRPRQVRRYGDERQQIVFAASGARHSFKELPAIEDAYAVEKHDQAGKANWPGDRGFWRKGADRQTDEQNRADAERETAEVDLPDQITDADGEEQREDRLRPDDILSKV